MHILIHTLDVQHDTHVRVVMKNKLYYKDDTKSRHSAIISSACLNSCCTCTYIYKYTDNLAVADVDLVIDDTLLFYVLSSFVFQWCTNIRTIPITSD